MSGKSQRKFRLISAFHERTKIMFEKMANSGDWMSLWKKRNRHNIYRFLFDVRRRSNILHFSEGYHLGSVFFVTNTESGRPQMAARLAIFRPFVVRRCNCRLPQTFWLRVLRSSRFQINLIPYLSIFVLKYYKISKYFLASKQREPLGSWFVRIHTH